MPTGAITGTIFWDPDSLNNAPVDGASTSDSTPLNTSTINGSLVITANRDSLSSGIGSTTVVGNPGQVTSAKMFESLIRTGAFGPTKTVRSCSASYKIDGLPLNEQLFIGISAKTPPFIGGNEGAFGFPLGNTAFVTLTSPSLVPGPNFTLMKLNG